VKGGNPREIQVHPGGPILLAEWKRSGFAKIYGRPPTPDNDVVPNRRRGGRPMNYRKPGPSLHSHTRDCTKVGIVARRDHDARLTFISLAREDDARADMLVVDSRMLSAFGRLLRKTEV